MDNDVERNAREGVFAAREDPVAEREGGGIGCVAVAPVGRIDAVYLVPEARGQGVVEMRRSDGEHQEGLPDLLLAWRGGA